MPKKSLIETTRETRLTTAAKTAWLAAGSILVSLGRIRQPSIADFFRVGLSS
jgi:hypothetical protein